jgi:enoyl-CoA hydratase/carnithine racemase
MSDAGGGALQYEVDGPVVRLTINRPEQRNALSLAMLERLEGILGDLAVQPEVRAVVLAGAGKDFCAGADVTELAEAADGAGAVAYGRAFDRALADLANHPVPGIARIPGAALGGGCQLAVACDMAVAAEDARMGIPSARLGIVIGYSSIERLVLAVGPRRASELLFTGRSISGQEAAAWGMVNRAVPAGELDPAVVEIAAAVTQGAPLSIRDSKRGIGAVLEAVGLNRAGERHSIEDFEMMSAQALASNDLREGIAAFSERRKPRFRGS